MATDNAGLGRGREVPITWNGARIAGLGAGAARRQDVELGSVRAVRLTEKAAGAIVAAGSRPARFEPLAMLLLRSEGVASSYIEGIRTPLVDVAAAEVGRVLSDATSYVADNLATVVAALRSSDETLTHTHLWSWHRALMKARGGLPAGMVGAYRTEQSWVGGTSPHDAALVPPPPELVPALMEDLVLFANDDNFDPVTQVAVLHAQFETIHPFGDGNGRIGRVLIGWLLARRLGVALPPPVSVLIARDPGGYLAGLTLFRLGQLDPWVEWLATALERSSEAAGALMARSEKLLDDWRARLAGVHTDSGHAGRRSHPGRISRGLSGCRGRKAWGLDAGQSDGAGHFGRTRHLDSLLPGRHRPRAANAVLGRTRARRACSGVAGHLKNRS